MTKNRVFSLFLALTLCFAALGAFTVQAAEPAYTVYKLADYEAVAVPSNATAEQSRRFTQVVDWEGKYGETTPLNQLFWQLDKSEYEAAGDTKPTFKIPLNVAASGKYQVAVKLYVGGDFGKFEVSLGGKALGTVECFGTGDLTFFHLGEVDLEAGTQDLVFTCLGWADGNISGTCNLGMGCLVLSPSGYYKLTNYLGKAVPSNRTDTAWRRFVQDMDRDWKDAWSDHYVVPEDNGQLFWELPKSEATNATFTIPLNVGTAGKYAVSARLFIGGDFGKFEVSLGGNVVGTVDCYGEGGLTDIALGEVELTAGANDLVFKCLGFNEGNVAGNCNLGINSLTLTAVAEEEPPSGDGEENPGTSDLFVALPVLAVVGFAGIVLIDKKRHQK